MRTAKRITTACLTAIMIFQALAPSTEVFAQELDAVMEASVSAARRGQYCPLRTGCRGHRAARCRPGYI